MIDRKCWECGTYFSENSYSRKDIPEDKRIKPYCCKDCLDRSEGVKQWEPTKGAQRR